MPEGNNAIRVSRSQRFRRNHFCPICGGYDQAGKGSRCWGFLSGDGRYIHCTRPEYAGVLPQGRDGTYSHYLAGLCRCGENHRTGGSLQSPPPIEIEVPEHTDKIKDRLERIFAGSQAIASGDPVDLYLLSRNIRLNTYPRDLRTHMALGYWEDGQRIGTYPAMIAVIRDAMGRPVGLHRTYLTMDGQKAPVPAPKKLTSLVGFSNAIQLSPFGTRLAIAEGIETALSFQILSGIPTWSCLSDRGIERFTPPFGIQEIIVAGDYDKAGILATEKLINRIGTQGTLVKTVFPDTPGKDWNDILKEGSHG